MRKNKVGKCGIGKNVFVKYEYNGLNADNFFSTVKRKGIDLFSVKKKGQKKAEFSVKYQDNEKFFANLQGLCYNDKVKKIKEYGKGYPLLFLLKNFGVLLGGIILILSSFMIDDKVLFIDYSGTGSVYKTEAQEYLTSNGVELFSNFRDFDLNKLADGLLSSNDRLSFVSVEKYGNRLKVFMVLSEDAPKRLDGNLTELVSTVDGVIEKITVYRGTCNFNVGDYVKVGDVLVSGYAIVKDQKTDVNVIASVSVISSAEYCYTDTEDGRESYAETLIREELSDKDVVEIKTEKDFDGEKYIYTVKVSVRSVISCG